MQLPKPSALPTRPRQHIRGPVPNVAAEPRRVRRRSRPCASTGASLRADLCGRGLRLGIVAVVLIGMAAVGRSLWQEGATRQADRLQASARQTAGRASQPWWSALFDPAARHAALAQASIPSLWDKRPAGAFVPVAHPFELNAPGPVVPRTRRDEPLASVRVAAVTLRRPDASAFHFGVPAPAAPVTLSRQTPVRATTGSSGPASPGGNAPQKALVSSPATTAAGPQPQAAGQELVVDSSNPNDGAVYAGASYTVPAAGDAYNFVYDGLNGTGLITHSDGTLTVSNITYLGYHSGSTGTYNLSGTGVLNSEDLYVGFGGVGVFSQSGGSVNLSFSLIIGSSSRTLCTYTLAGPGARLSSPNEVIGLNGPGTFIQNGGTNTVTSPGGLDVGGSGAGIYALNGGTLQTQTVISSIGTFNFNGGTLQASAGSTTFLQGLTTANVQTGGAVIDTQGFNVTIAQNLVHDTTANAPATDGGLTKLGTGTLTLTGNNTYAGGTTLDAGTLALGSATALGSTGTFTVAGGTVTPSGGNRTVVNPVSLTGSATIGASVETGGPAEALTFTNTLTPTNAPTLTVNNNGLTTLGAVNLGSFSRFYLNGTGNVTIGGQVSDTGGGGQLIYFGSGLLTLTAANTYGGGTTVNAGTVLVNNTSGSGTGSGAVMLNGGVLGGTGTISNNLFVNGGTLRPGIVVGRLTVGGGVDLSGDSTLSISLGGTVANSSYTQLYVGDTLSLSSALLSVQAVNGFTLGVGQTFFIIDRTGTDLSQIGTFGNAPGGIYTDAAGDTFLVNYQANDLANGDLLPNDVSLMVLSVVPEPETWSVMFIGVGLLGVALRRHACTA